MFNTAILSNCIRESLSKKQILNVIVSILVTFFTFMREFMF